MRAWDGRALLPTRQIRFDPVVQGVRAGTGGGLGDVEDVEFVVLVDVLFQSGVDALGRIVRDDKIDGLVDFTPRLVGLDLAAHDLAVGRVLRLVGQEAHRHGARLPSRWGAARHLRMAECRERGRCFMSEPTKFEIPIGEAYSTTCELRETWSTPTLDRIRYTFWIVNHKQIS